MTPDLLVHILLTGVGATLCMDLWALLLKRRFGIPSLDYALVGRWFLGMFDGRWFHATIVTAPPRRGENNRLDIALRRRHRVCLYPDRFGGHQVVYGAGAAHRTVERLAELAAPFLVMQPALGFGVAAAKPPTRESAAPQPAHPHGVWAGPADRRPAVGGALRLSGLTAAWKYRGSAPARAAPRVANREFHPAAARECAAAAPRWFRHSAPTPG